MEVLPCSRVAHIERTKKPYNNDIDYYAKRNALRAAEVWMDDFKSHVYMAWNIPMTNPGVDFGDVSERLALRQRLQCRSFKWYLENVYPEMRIYNNTITYGEVRNSKASGYCLDQGAEDDDRAILYPCHGMSSQMELPLTGRPNVNAKAQDRWCQGRHSDESMSSMLQKSNVKIRGYCEISRFLNSRKYSIIITLAQLAPILLQGCASMPGSIHVCTAKAATCSAVTEGPVHSFYSVT
ncbi:polypeptide N-acetylgalactosaminyltransferase 9 [Gracilinanus agilis]|uniref:polypeptide N-acetylgalactosaminyltransferase 9 n=1 Tax=Gracilinanus agilis TaxID=191870 RepID=UPI001CFE9140|nr:polypeptide N-acetylgalactosaminyltransferase 9 [Gracilinanus agilis]